MWSAERVIGALKSRYHILDGPLPLRLVKRLQDERQKTEEAMMEDCACLCSTNELVWQCHVQPLQNLRVPELISVLLCCCTPCHPASDA
ncbi:hypothetical protein CgunFtcFv8_011001 [Champsocephalus gunnari]|uniref:Uncharacterized protein n=1 Tax=Champsocephalus gunnari TaxID=52237 RepID=A0AAN8I039_CHAGU|nr:hypothetical protein CgunFtcFv8_011001 [Champsocephalus gunnari]